MCLGAVDPMARGVHTHRDTTHHVPNGRCMVILVLQPLTGGWNMFVLGAWFMWGDRSGAFCLSGLQGVMPILAHAKESHSTVHRETRQQPHTTELVTYPTHMHLRRISSVKTLPPSGEIIPAQKNTHHHDFTTITFITKFAITEGLVTCFFVQGFPKHQTNTFHA